MYQNYDQLKEAALERVNQLKQEAAHDALVEAANPDKEGVRQLIGRSLIAMGEKIAGEPKQLGGIGY